MSRRKLVAMAGLPASGKSALGTLLQKSLNAVLLDKDKVRHFLFESHVDYSNEQNDLCLNVMYDVAHYLLNKSDPPVVILDGRTYSRTYQVEALKAAALRAKSQLYLIECTCSPRTAKRRLQQDRDTGAHLAGDRDYALYLKSRAAAEGIEESRLVLDTDQYSTEQCLTQALAYVQEES